MNKKIAYIILTILFIILTAAGIKIHANSDKNQSLQDINKINQSGGQSLTRSDESRETAENNTNIDRSLEQGKEQSIGQIQEQSNEQGFGFYQNSSDAGAISRIPVLMYHSINEVPIGLEQLSVRTSDFEQQIKYLSENGFTPMSFDDLKNIALVRKPVIITFDDGYIDNYQNAYPILKKYNCKAIIFLIAKSINVQWSLMEGQIREMGELVSFQSHTVKHLELDKLSDSELEKECSESKRIIGEVTKKPVNVLSYPVGKYNDKVASVASKYYDYAVTTKSGYYKAGDDKYRISRIRVSRSDTLKEFISRLQ